MVRLCAAATALLMITTIATPLAAAPNKKKHRHYATAPWRTYAQRTARPPNESAYYEHDADKLRIGSQRWWDQMRREGRLGGETP
jgi:hypothetical protein